MNCTLWSIIFAFAMLNSWIKFLPFSESRGEMSRNLSKLSFSMIFYEVFSSISTVFEMGCDFNDCLVSEAETRSFDLFCGVGADFNL